MKASQGIAASMSLPQGTWVRIQDFGEFVILDKGLLDKDHIDVWVPTRTEAVKLGVKYKTVSWEE